MMRKQIKAICKMCGKEFFKWDSKGTKHGLHDGVRQSNAVTCSKQCSRGYHTGLGISSQKIKK